MVSLLKTGDKRAGVLGGRRQRIQNEHGLSLQSTLKYFCEVIIRGPDWSLGLVPNSQNGSLGLVPIFIIDVWDQSQRYILYIWDQIMGDHYLVPNIQNVSLGLVPDINFKFWDWSQRAVLSIWDQIFRMIIWMIIQSQTYKMALWDQSQRAISDIWDQINSG